MCPGRTTEMWLCVSLALLLVHVQVAECGIGMLYPRDSESRETKFLDGVWQFRADQSPTRNQGFDQKWWTKRLSQARHVAVLFTLLRLSCT